MSEEIKANIKKRKREEVLVTESLDNTASVKSIVNFLQSKSKKNKVYGYYCQTIRQRSVSNVYLDAHHQIPGHPLNAFNEEWDGSLKSGYFETFTHRTLLPKIISSLRHIEIEDPLIELVAKTQEWNKKWRTYRNYYAKMNRKLKFEWLDDDIVYCPEKYVEIAEHWEMKPDHFFDSTYNWYYAGAGNIHHISIGGTDYLIHSELNCVYLTPFNQDSLEIDYKNSVTFDCGVDRNIFETVYSDNMILALRTKHKIFVLKIIDTDGHLQLQKIKSVDFDLPMTSLSFDEYHKNILYVTALDFHLYIINIDRMKCRTKKLRGRIPTLVDNWNTVIGTERDCYTHVSNTAVTLYDKRNNEPVQRWKNVKHISDEIVCNSITAAQYCTGKPLLYIGTDHHLFLLDIRQNSSNKMKAVQRWTHGMQCPPTYISISPFEYNKELICFASQWCKDMCMVTNYADRLTRHDEISGVMIPYRPPSILKTLSDAKEKMLCCDLYDPIDVRLVTGVSGLCVLEQGDNKSILMQNSLGDISCHSLFSEGFVAMVCDDSLEQLHEWSKSYKREMKKDFEVSKIIDIKKVWQDLKRVPNDYVFGRSRFKQSTKSKYDEQEVFDSFGNDQLDSGLLDVWMKNQNGHAEDEDEPTLNLLFANNEDDDINHDYDDNDDE